MTDSLKKTPWLNLDSTEIKLISVSILAAAQIVFWSIAEKQTPPGDPRSKPQTVKNASAEKGQKTLTSTISTKTASRRLRTRGS